MTTTVPSWLNLDGIAPPGLGDEIEQLRDRLRLLVPTMTDLVRDASTAIARAETAGRSAVDQLPEEIGVQVLDGVMSLVTGVLGAADLYEEVGTALTALGTMLDGFDKLAAEEVAAA